MKHCYDVKRQVNKPKPQEAFVVPICAIIDQKSIFVPHLTFVSNVSIDEDVSHTPLFKKYDLMDPPKCQSFSVTCVFS